MNLLWIWKSLLHSSNNNYANFGVLFEGLLLKILLLLLILWQKVSSDRKIMIQLLQIASDNGVSQQSSQKMRPTGTISSWHKWCIATQLIDVWMSSKQTKKCNKSLSCEKQVFLLFVYTIWPLFCNFFATGVKKAPSNC